MPLATCHLPLATYHSTYLLTIGLRHLRRQHLPLPRGPRRVYRGRLGLWHQAVLGRRQRHVRQTAAQAAAVEPTGESASQQVSPEEGSTHHVKLTYSLTYSLTHLLTYSLTHSLTYWHVQYLIPLLLAGLLCSSAMSSVYGEYDFPPGGVACGWALALVCCAPTPIVAWRALKPCRWLWRRLRRRGVGAPPRVGDAAAGSRRRSNTRSGAGSEMYTVRAGNLQGASKRSPPQTSL